MAAGPLGGFAEMLSRTASHSADRLHGREPEPETGWLTGTNGRADRPTPPRRRPDAGKLGGAMGGTSSPQMRQDTYSGRVPDVAQIEDRQKQ